MMQFLTAEQHPKHLQFRVLLDTDKTKPDGKPDERFVRHYRFAAKAPSGWSDAKLNGTAYTDWAAYCAAEVKLLAAADLAAITGTEPVTALPMNGQTFN
ncbi:MAG: hypothetical protein ACYCSN_15485 [Acidobacteriaceae bacterium]